MRLIAEVTDDPKVKRLMLTPEKAGCFVFVFDSLEDRSCFADHWYESVADAQVFCLQTYGVEMERWTEIDDAPDGCKQDRIAMVPVKAMKTR